MGRPKRHAASSFAINLAALRVKKNKDAPLVKKDGTARIRVPSMGCFIFLRRVS